MVKKSVEDGYSIPPFLLKCFEMVDDQSTDSLISWSTTGDSFVIWDKTDFSVELLPKYFKHNTFSSFVRQLNIYGFRKADTDRWEFENDGFIKGQKHLLKNISRRKNSQGLVQQNSEQKNEDVGVNEESKDVGLWKEVDCLKHDKNVLMDELVILRQHQQNSASKLLLLREQLKGMEKNQQQMLSFIVMAMQSPGFLVQFLQPKDNNWRMAETGNNILEQVMEDCDPVPSDGVLVRYQPPKDPSPETLITPTSDSEKPLELDLSTDEMNDLLMNIDFLLGPPDREPLLFENHGPVILPDLPDGDCMLEHMLSSPSLGRNRDSKFDSEALTDPGEATESRLYSSQQDGAYDFASLSEGLERSHLEPQLDNCADWEYLPEHMESQGSERSC